jgi:hypothetical protein
VLVPAVAVGTVGVPVRAGDASGAFRPNAVLIIATADATNPVLAICVVLVPSTAVGAVGVPVRAGDASGAFKPNAVLIVVLSTVIAAATNPVLAIWTLLVPAVAVGVVGVPVSAGESSGAFVASSVVCDPDVVSSVVNLGKIPSISKFAICITLKVFVSCIYTH